MPRRSKAKKVRSNRPTRARRSKVPSFRAAGHRLSGSSGPHRQMDGGGSGPRGPASINVDVFVGDRVNDLRMVSYRYSSAYFHGQRKRNLSNRRVRHVGRSLGQQLHVADGTRPKVMPVSGSWTTIYSRARSKSPAQPGPWTTSLYAAPRLVDFTVEPGEPVATGIGTSWWRWTAPSDGRFTWKMDGPSAYRLTILHGRRTGKPAIRRLTVRRIGIRPRRDRRYTLPDRCRTCA